MSKSIPPYIFFYRTVNCFSGILISNNSFSLLTNATQMWTDITGINYYSLESFVIEIFKTMLAMLYISVM